MISQIQETVATSLAPTLRSNELATKAREQLEQNAYFRGRSHNIRIDEQADTLVLYGTLPSFYLKQVLQTALRDIDGVNEIDNRVEVFWPSSSSSERE